MRHVGVRVAGSDGQFGGSALLIGIFDVVRAQRHVAEGNIAHEEIVHRAGIGGRVRGQDANRDIAYAAAIDRSRRCRAAGNVVQQVADGVARAGQGAAVDRVAQDRDGLRVLHRLDPQALPLPGLRRIRRRNQLVVGNRVGACRTVEQVVENARAGGVDFVAADARGKTARRGLGIVVGLYADAHQIHQVAGHLRVEIVLQDDADAPTRRIDIGKAVEREQVAACRPVTRTRTIAVKTSVGEIAKYTVPDESVVRRGKHADGFIRIGAVERIVRTDRRVVAIDHQAIERHAIAVDLHDRAIADREIGHRRHDDRLVRVARSSDVARARIDAFLRTNDLHRLGDREIAAGAIRLGIAPLGHAHEPRRVHMRQRLGDARERINAEISALRRARAAIGRRAGEADRIAIIARIGRIDIHGVETAQAVVHHAQRGIGGVVVSARQDRGGVGGRRRRAVKRVVRRVYVAGEGPHIGIGCRIVANGACIVQESARRRVDRFAIVVVQMEIPAQIAVKAIRAGCPESEVAERCATGVVVEEFDRATSIRHAAAVEGVAVGSDGHLQRRIRRRIAIERLVADHQRNEVGYAACRRERVAGKRRVREIFHQHAAIAALITGKGVAGDRHGNASWIAHQAYQRKIRRTVGGVAAATGGRCVDVIVADGDRAGAAVWRVKLQSATVERVVVDQSCSA